jgi:lysozyme family protein
MNFEAFIDKILAAEGGYADHPSDRGGPTMYGVTEAVARRSGYDGPMQELPESLAREIYRKRYIVRPAFDKVAAISPAIGFELADTGVNMGPARASEFLQRWLNGLNARGSRYADLFVDGRIGEVTLTALRAYLRWRGPQGERVLLSGLDCVQGARYLEIAEGNPSQEDFLYGWVLHRINTGMLP